MIKNTTSSRLAILHEIEKYLTDAESDKAAAYSHLAFVLYGKVKNCLQTVDV